jgi:hypothetical protein
VPLRATVNGGNFIGEGLPTVNVDASKPVLASPDVAKSVAAALDRKGGVLISGQGVVMTAGSVYNLADRAYQVKQDAKIQAQAMGLRGKVNFLVDLPQPAVAAAADEGGRGGRGGRGEGNGQGGQGGQQLGPVEGRAWVYWVETTPIN